MVCLRLFAGIMGFVLKWPVDGEFQTVCWNHGLCTKVTCWWCVSDCVWGNRWCQLPWWHCPGRPHAVHRFLHWHRFVSETCPMTWHKTDASILLKIPARIWCKAISCKGYENTLVPTNLTVTNYEALWCGPVLTVNLACFFCFLFICLFLLISFFIS